jgi:SAM-dependent methyltransferase
VPTRDEDLASAFDGQAAAFERSKTVRDAASIARLVEFAAFPPGSSILEGGCGPGLVAEAFLEAGHRVLGVDLSAEMIRRARERCARFGDRARFEQRSLFDLGPETFDAAVSRNVLHHRDDPHAFLARQAALLRPGGVLVALDLSGDPDPVRHDWSHRIERERDRTHVRVLTPGELVDLLAGIGLVDIRLAEEEVLLDFDEWFDRGTPSVPKEAVRGRLASGTSRGLAPSPRPDGGFDIRMLRALVRGVRP